MRKFVLLLLACAPLLWPADTLSRHYLHEIDLIENDVLKLAEAMPADRYIFVPKEGAIEGVRSFGDQVKHMATMMYMTSALVLGERSPYGPGEENNGPPEVQGKEAIVTYLKSALAYARKAMGSITETNLLDPVQTYFGPMPRLSVANGITYHSYNHYGQMVVYARLNGIVPPGSVPAR